jgi:hypothetical protein
VQAIKVSFHTFRYLSVTLSNSSRTSFSLQSHVLFSDANSILNKEGTFHLGMCPNTLQ